MLQAIITKWHGPTNTRGARMTATANPGRKSTSYDHGLSADDNHKAAAHAYATAYGWLDGWKLESGGMPNGDVCHVLVKA